MDYEKKYNETLERAKSIKDSIIASHNKEFASYYTGFIDNIFPELKESEDERIRKELRAFISSVQHTHLCANNKREKWLAYLEKRKEPHFTKRNALFDECVAKCDPAIMKKVSDKVDEMLGKEQKPAEDKDAIEPTPKQDYSGLTDFERAIHRGFLCAGVENVPVGIIKDTAQDCLTHIKPAEWSEEYEGLIDLAVAAIEEFYDKSNPIRVEIINFLKSFRFQPHWKPSEEQMDALNKVVNGDVLLTTQHKSLESLYNDLSKL